MIKEQSLRGNIIKTIVDYLIEENLYGSLDTLKEDMQTKLNENLRFKTLVSDITQYAENGLMLGEIYFENDMNRKSMISFTVAPGICLN